MTSGRALVFAGIIAALAIAEIAMRLAGIASPEVRCYDTTRGWRLKPDAVGRQRSEGHADVTINRAGFRGPEVSIAKAPGILRIAVLGDSFAEALQVPYDQSFCAVAEHALGHCQLGGRRVQVLDFGVSGYGTGQELLTLRDQVWRYSPDIVLLAFFAGNDVSDNSAALDTESWLNAERCRPHYAIRGGALVEDDEFHVSPFPALWCRSVFWLNRLTIMDYVGEPVVMLHRLMSPCAPRADVPGHESGLDDAVYGPPPDARWREAWAVTEDLIAAMNREVRARGAQFLLVTLSAPVQVYPDRSYRTAYLSAVGGSDLFYAEHRLDALGVRNGFPVFNLAQPMQAWADRNHAYVHGFPNTRMGHGHWNAFGHEFAGRLIAERIGGLVQRAAAPR